MKKLFIMLLAVMVIMSSVALAEDLSSLSDDDLLDLYMRVSEEMADRWVSSRQDALPDSFRSAVEAADAAGLNSSVGGSPDHLAVITEKDGKYIRTVTLLDDHAKELFLSALQAEGDFYDFTAFEEYAWSLPVSYTEEFNEKPKEQPELDAMAGKTIWQLMDEEGYQSMTLPYGSADDPVVFTLAFGIFEYEFEVDAAYKDYLLAEAGGTSRDLKVKSGRFSGFSRLATDLNYHTDGTYRPRENGGLSEEDDGLMVKIADRLAGAWENGEPDPQTKEALIVELTELYPEAEEMIREMVESYTSGTVSP